MHVAPALKKRRKGKKTTVTFCTQCNDNKGGSHGGHNSLALLLLLPLPCDTDYARIISMHLLSYAFFYNAKGIPVLY